MRTANPALNGDTFGRAGYESAASSDRMTINGTVNKTGVLLVILLIPATWIWGQVYGAWQSPAAGPLMMGGLIGGLVFALATIFKKEWAPVTAPLYAACEGLVLGGI